MIIVIHGEDTFRSKQKLKEIVRAFERRMRGYRVARFDEHASFVQVHAATENASLFSAKACVVLEDSSTNRELAESIFASKMVARAAKNTDITLIFFEHTSLAKNKTYAPVIQAAGKNAFEYKTLSERAAAAWFADFLKSRHPMVSAAIISDVVRRCNANMWQVYNELEKLRAYTGSLQPTQHDIEMLNIGGEEAQLFPMLDALFAGRADEAFLGLQVHWLRGEHPHGIFHMIERQLKIIALVKEQSDAGERSASAIAQKTGLHPFVISKSLRVANRFPWPKLKELYARVESLDHKSKVGRIDPYLACELLSAAVIA